MKQEPDITRARWQLWAVTFAIMLGLAAGIAVLSTSGEVGALPDFIPSRLLLAVALTGMVGAFVVYAIDRERHLHRLSARLVQELLDAKQLSERLRFLSELSRERDTNAALLDASADGIAVIGVAGDILRFNRAMEDLTGIATGDALGMPARDVLRFEPATDTDGKPFEDPIAAVLTDGEPRRGRELRMSRPGTPEGWVSATLSPVKDPASGETALVLVTVRDIADQKEQERMQHDFVSMAAHELRSPLTAIKGFARTLLLKGEALPKDKRDAYLSMVNDQSNRLARLVDDLMQVTRIDAGRVVLEPEELDVGVIVRDLIDQFGDRWRNRAISINSNGCLPVASADPHRLEEILINLIDNAIKYSPAGSPVDVTMTTRDGELVVSVTDHGIGIPTDDVPSLFKKFFRISSEETADIQGTGLGLYIVKGLIEAHGGTVWATSEPGTGSTFSFTLPLTILPAATGTGGP